MLDFSVFACFCLFALHSSTLDLKLNNKNHNKVLTLTFNLRVLTCMLNKQCSICSTFLVKVIGKLS